MQDLEIIGEQLLATGWVEGLAVLLGIVQVVLAYYNKLINFYAGIGSTALFIFLFLESKLYAEAGLNVYYFIISIYGIYAWSNAKGDPAAKIAKTKAQEWLIASGIAVGAFIVIYLVLRFATDSTVPIMDALVSSFAWSGTWLMARRRLEYWLVLNVSNAIAIPLLWYKGLYLTSLLTVLLFVLAVLGYLHWRKQLAANDSKL